jgi:S1-C subfamily serine protease
MMRLPRLFLPLIAFLIIAAPAEALEQCKGSRMSALGIFGNWNNCVGTWTLHRRSKWFSTYVGEFQSGLAHGQGTRTYYNGAKYVGGFRNNRHHGKGSLTNTNGSVKEGMWDMGKFLYSTASTKTAKKTPPRPNTKPSNKSGSTGSGFFISKLGHVITNQHVVNKCKRVTVGDSAKTQVTATVLETDRRNDLALLRISNMTMASAETKSLITKLGIAVVPLATQGLLRSDEIELGEDVLVAGYPYGDTFSNTIKVTKGIVSANRGMGDDTGQFQIDAAVQPGNSGGPIYDAHGNIVGVVVAQLNKLKIAKAIGSLPENVNFGIKASTVRQFLNASGLPTKWSKRSKSMSTRDLAKIAKNQTVMVVCHR